MGNTPVEALADLKRRRRRTTVAAIEISIDMDLMAAAARAIARFPATTEKAFAARAATAYRMVARELTEREKEVEDDLP